MAGSRSFSPNPISIGNCKVEIEGNGFGCQSNGETLLISVPDAGKIKISVDDSRKNVTRKSCNNLLPSVKTQENGDGCCPLEDHSFLLVNPKDVDSRHRSLLQEILKIYIEELPAMNYSANTGRESQFLQKCTSSGKYRTLILKSNSSEVHGKVIAALTYQIIPADTQYAEIPLAAVSSNYQSKGIGHLMVKELKERLQGVGTLTIFCWADKESEGFWLKQGFVSIGEVDGKGKARRLPIKAEIRRALCFPGGSTLMVTHLKKETMASVTPSEHIKLCSSLKSLDNALSCIASKTLGQVEIRTNDASNFAVEAGMNPVCHQVENIRAQLPMEDGCSTDLQNDSGVFPGAIRLPRCASLVPCPNMGCKCTEDLEVAEDGCGTDDRCYSSGQRIKRRRWEASLSSLKSKRVSGGHLINCCKDADPELPSVHVRGIDAFDDCSLDSSRHKPSVELIPNSPSYLSYLGTEAEGKVSDHINDDLVSKGNCARIMFMNIADDAKKTWLTKIVGELGGSVTCTGTASTHIITGKARRTLNFCTALCSGAWIVSPHWLKASFREGKFLGESQFILEDEDYLSKYKSELKDAVIRAKTRPHSLLKGYNVCVAKHIQPSVDVLSAIIKSAGGNAIRRMEGIQEPSKTIFLACEEDMEDAMVAAKMGLWTFSSEWFMSCVMKQELDFEAPQFSEPL